ncbi:hypothetical protein ACHQM5_015339 [Ranunculus cassubicifolius]
MLVSPDCSGSRLRLSVGPTVSRYTSIIRPTEEVFRDREAKILNPHTKNLVRLKKNPCPSLKKKPPSSPPSLHLPVALRSPLAVAIAVIDLPIGSINGGLRCTDWSFDLRMMN